MDNEQLLARNHELAAISAEMFGPGMRLQIVAPESLSLLKDNARFFKRETFRQHRGRQAPIQRAPLLSARRCQA